MSTLQIESLWQFILTMSLSKRNKQWLAERLLENINDDSSEDNAELNVQTSNAPIVETAISNVHSSWGQRMAKYRILEPMDDKDAFIESLDERYR